MSRLKLYFLPLLAVALLFVLAVPGLAQETTFGLSAADWELLNNANTNSAAADSVFQEFVFSAQFSSPDESGTINASGSGPLILNGDGGPALQMNLQADVTDSSGNQTGTAELRVVDGVIYATNDGGATWDAQLLEEALSSAAGGVTGQPGAALDPSMLAAIPGADALLSDPNALLNSGFIAMTRGADANGQAAFTVDLDIATLLSSESLAPLLGMAAMGGASGTDIPPEQLATITGMFSSLFQETDITVEQDVDLATGLISRTNLSINLSLDPSIIGQTGGAITLILDLEVWLTRYNETFEIVAPEGVEIPAASSAAAPVISTAAPLANATGAVTVSTPLTVALTGVGPVDVAFAGANGTYNVYVRSLEADGVLDTTVAILDASGSIIANNDDHTSARPELTTRDSAIEGVDLSPASIIQVGSFISSAVGSVELTVEPVDSTNAVGPNTNTTGPGTGSGSSASAPDALTFEGELVANGRFTTTFEASAGDIVTITARDTSGTLDPKLDVRDSNAVLLSSNDDLESPISGLDERDSRIPSLTIPETGTYTIEVTDFFGQAGTVEVTVAFGAAAAQVQVTGAAQLTVGTPVNGDAGTNSTTYTFAGQAGQEVTFAVIALTPPSPDLDMQVTVIGPDGTQVGYNDDHGTSSPGLGDRDALLVVTLPVTGTYQVIVESWFDTAGQYRLTIQ